MSQRIEPRFFTTKSVLLVGALAALAAGCSAEASGPDAPEIREEASATLLAEVTKDGTQYSFLRSESGDLTVLVSGPAADPANGVGPGDSFVALYERLSGQTAPADLVSAELALRDLDRQNAATRSGSDQPPSFYAGDDVSSSTERDGIAQTAQALTSAEFQNLYCPGGMDFLYCWPSTGGNPWVQRMSVYLHGAMNATNCNTRFRYRYYDDGWKTLVDRIATPGQHFHYYTWGGESSRRFEVLDNAGCGVRFAVYGLS
ncbi:MAG TPA: hypothetical protein VK524_08885 [Polyangiaceae bacterium]|nr:hypothetical protein [Polyangiaceae bacterium]